VSPVVAKLGHGDSSAVTINELEAIAGADPEFTLRLLALANSAFYSQQHEITSLRGALIVLGAETTHNLAAGLLAHSLLSESDVVSRAIWRHSQAVGAAAQLLAELHRRVRPEEAFVAGLLHDIGVLALLRTEPERYRRAVSADALTCAELDSVEQEYFRIDHAVLGAEIAELLGLSPALQAVIRHHHDPLVSGKKPNALEATVLIGNHLANCFGYEVPVDCEIDDAQYRIAVSSLQLVESDVEKLATCLPQRVRKLAETMQIAAGAAE
jgi:putative nucleotidyltransferase with HDIG domain